MVCVSYTVLLNMKTFDLLSICCATVLCAWTSHLKGLITHLNLSCWHKDSKLTTGLMH